MNIGRVRAVAVNLKPQPNTKPRVESDLNGGHFVSPMARYEQELPRWAWSARWPTAACVVTAEDGSWGLGLAPMAGPVCSVINDHFAEILVGQEPMATEKSWDPCQVVLALWDGGHCKLRDQRRRQRDLGPERQIARPTRVRTPRRAGQGILAPRARRRVRGVAEGGPSPACTSGTRRSQSPWARARTAPPATRREGPRACA